MPYGGNNMPRVETLGAIGDELENTLYYLILKNPGYVSYNKEKHKYSFEMNSGDDTIHLVAQSYISVQKETEFKIYAASGNGTRFLLVSTNKKLVGAFDFSYKAHARAQDEKYRERIHDVAKRLLGQGY
jgi:hypothetical protein